MDKRILKEIAKRIAKSILYASDEVMLMDEKEVFSFEEIKYLQEQISIIADRITDKPVYTDFSKMLKEYYDSD